jgi:hypothetical protein
MFRHFLSRSNAGNTNNNSLVVLCSFRLFFGMVIDFDGAWGTKRGQEIFFLQWAQPTVCLMDTGGKVAGTGSKPLYIV